MNFLAPTVSDVMSRPLVTLELGTTLLLAEWLMKKRRIRHLPVVDPSGRAVGLVTHKTIMAHAGDVSDVPMLSVADIMAKKPITVLPSARAADAARFMVENRIGCVIVVDSDDTAIGIVTEADLIAFAAKQLARTPRIAVDDFMTTDVVALRAGDSLELADELMNRGGFRHIPIVDDDHTVVGMVTHRDLLAAKFSSPASAQIASAESAAVWSVTSGSSALSAVRMLADHTFGCLPVTRDSKLIGIITEADVVELLVRLLTTTGAFGRAAGSVRFYMSTPVRCVDVDCSLSDARDLLARYGISSLAVVGSENNLVGVISATDFVDRAKREASVVVGMPLLDLPAVTVGEVMSRKVITISGNDSIEAAAKTLSTEKIHRVFVVDHGRLIGVVATADVVRAVRDLRVHTPLSEIMSPLVITIGPGEDITSGIRFLESADVRALIVVEQGWPVGVLNQRHLLDARNSSRGTVVEDVMSGAVISLPAALPAFRAAAMMAHLGVDHVVAIGQGAPVGVVTGIDMARLCVAPGGAEGAAKAEPAN